VAVVVVKVRTLLLLVAVVQEAVAVVVILLAVIQVEQELLGKVVMAVMESIFHGMEVAAAAALVQ
jgi:hypothetical protein